MLLRFSSFTLMSGADCFNLSVVSQGQLATVPPLAKHHVGKVLLLLSC
jgi:hypothetical protein